MLTHKKITEGCNTDKEKVGAVKKTETFYCKKGVRTGRKKSFLL